MVVLNPDKAKIRNVNIMVEGTNVSLGVVDIIMTTDMNMLAIN